MATPQPASAAAAQKFQYQKERPPNFEEKVEALSVLVNGRRTEDDLRMALDQSNYDADAAFSLLEDDTKWTFRSVNKPKTEVPPKEAPKKERKPNPEEGQKPQRTNFKDRASKPRAEQKDAPSASQDGQERRYRNKEHRIRENVKGGEADGANGDAKPYTRTYRNKKDFSRGEEGQQQNAEGKSSQRQFASQRPNKFQSNRPREQINPDTSTGTGTETNTGKEDQEGFLTIKMVIRTSPAPENATEAATESISAPTTEANQDALTKTETPAAESAAVAPVEENTSNAVASTEAFNTATEASADNQESANSHTATNIKLSTKSSPKGSKSGSSSSTATKSSAKRAPEAQPKVSWVIKQKTPISGNDGDAEASSTEAAKQEEPAVQTPVETPKPVPAVKEPKKTAAPKEKPQFQFRFGSLDTEKETPAAETTVVAAKEEVAQATEAVAPAESTATAISPVPVPVPVTETQAAPEESPAIQPAPTSTPVAVPEPEQYVPTKTEQPEITQTNIPIDTPQIVPSNTSILTPGLISTNTSSIPSLQASNTSQENTPTSTTASLASSSVVLSHPGHQSAPTISAQLPASQRNFANTAQNTQSYTQPRATSQGHNPGAQYQQYRNTMANQQLGQVYYQASEGQAEDASDIATQSPSSNPNQLYMSSHVADYGKSQMYAGYGDASQGYMTNPSQAVANGGAGGKPTNRPHNPRDKYPPTGNPADVPGGMPHPAFPYFPIFFPPPYQYPYFAPYQGPPPPFNGGKGVGGSNFKGGSFPPAPGAFPYPIPYPMAYDEEGHGYPPHYHPAMYMDPNQQAVHQGGPKGPGGNQGAADINPRGKPQPPMGGHGADYGQANPYGQPSRFQSTQQQGNVGQYGNYGHPGASSGAWNH